MNKLKTRYNCTNVLEISIIMDIEEMSLTENDVIRISGKFENLDFP